MSRDLQTAPTSKAMLWTGWILGGLPSLFMLFDAAMKLVKPKFVIDATVKLGYPESVIVGLGIVVLVCTILYLIPRTAVLGAILLTGYLGGAVASHLRAGDPPFAIGFPVVFGMLLWGGLYLRDGRLRVLVPWRT
jgi:hypothetical protein